MAAAGKICTGFSLPYVALYSNSGYTVTYTGVRKLARGVSISISPDVPSDNNFYADNVTAETAPGKFNGGTATLTVDGLLDDARKMVFGLPDPTSLTVGTATVDIYALGEAMEIPYVGIGYIVRYQSDGVESFVATVLTKARFDTPGGDHTTQEEEISWETEELNVTLLRDDTTAKNWKLFSEDLDSEVEAEKALIVMLGGTLPSSGG